MYWQTHRYRRQASSYIWIAVACRFSVGKKKRRTDQVHRKHAVKHSNNDSVNQINRAAPALRR